MLSRRGLLGALASGPTLSAVATAQDGQGRILYHNPLKTASDVSGFVLEGGANISFDHGRMRLQNANDPALGQASNFVFWCPEHFPDNVEISWSFWPVAEPGLCVAFFAAKGLIDGHRISVFDKRLKPRTGIYDHYTQSDVSALSISYFRRRWPEERAFHLANLRQSPGFTLLTQGADPLPDVADATPPYRIKISKKATSVAFSINDLLVLSYVTSKDQTLPEGGAFGFRQMAPLIADYADLTVRAID